MTEETNNGQKAADDSRTDLGFGSVVTRESRKRLLNRDGSFNVRREGLSLWESVPLYHLLLTMTWPRFLGLVALVFFVTNAVFAVAYVWLGPASLEGTTATTLEGRFAEAFFFSVHTLSTIGYGNVVPKTLGANFVVAIESFASLLALAIIAGIVFARFSRPTARIIFSDVAVVAPFGEGTAFMFRIANQQSSQLVEIEAKVLFTIRMPNGRREFASLSLERERVVFFPLTWTVVHPIDETSPLYQITREDLIRGDAEFLILVTAFEEIHSQTVHRRCSYKPDEIVFGARFKSVFNPIAPGEAVSVDIQKIHEIERVGEQITDHG